MSDVLQLDECPVCGCSGFEEFVTFVPIAPEPLEEGRYVRCSGCDLVYLNPRPARKTIDAFMNSVYDPAGEKEVVARFWRDQTWFVKLLEKYVPARGRLFEIGCGSGQLLKAAHDRGWDVAGVEVAPDAVRWAVENLSLEIFEGDFLELNFEPESYDAVVMLNVIEHVDDPQPFLNKAAEILKPGGFLLMRTPNLDLWYNMARIKKGLPIVSGLTTHHFYYFNLDSLAPLLKKAGFTLAHHTTYNVDELTFFKKNLMAMNRQKAMAYFQNYIYGIFHQGSQLTLIGKK